jgi:nitrate reductase (cytochrome), electron transfer subunit
MSRRFAPDAGMVTSVVLVALVAAGLVAVVAALDPGAARRATAARYAAAAPVIGAGAPIASEAHVYRSAFSDEHDGAEARPAHPRTLDTYRALRAYPGAPPRVPHGLTADEFRTTACNTCHERGGYSPRFGAYAPLTPHPELSDCLQCHTVDNSVLGMALPGPTADDVCRQCHVLTPDARAAAAPAGGRAWGDVDWRPAAWPGVHRVDGTPPPITHDLQLRGDCRACHTGPAAVAEMRTRHGDRPACRQCHLLAGAADDEFTRPATGGWSRGANTNGGAP